MDPTGSQAAAAGPSVADWSFANVVNKVLEGTPPKKHKNLLRPRNDSDLRHIIYTSGDKPVVVMHGAFWCDHCKAVLPRLIEYSEEFPQALFAIVDVDEAAQVTKHVRYTPTFSFYHRAKKVDEFHGNSVQRLKDHIWMQHDRGSGRY